MEESTENSYSFSSVDDNCGVQQREVLNNNTKERECVQFLNWFVIVPTVYPYYRQGKEAYQIYTLEITVQTSNGKELNWSKKVRYRDCFKLNRALTRRILLLEEDLFLATSPSPSSPSVKEEEYLHLHLPLFPQKRPKVLFNDSFLRDRHYLLQEYFKQLPQRLFETPEMVAFLDTISYITEKGFDTTHFEERVNSNCKVRVVSTSRRGTRDSDDGRRRSTSGSNRGLKLSSEKELRDTSILALQPKRGETVLEIGYSTGQALISLAKSVGSTGLVCGIDVSESMLNATQDQLNKNGIFTDNIHLYIGDATQQLPFSDDSFDMVYISFTLELFTDQQIPLVLSECMRVLKVGGRIGVVAVSKREQQRSSAEKVYEWLYCRLPSLVSSSSSSSSSSNSSRPIFVSKILESAGFSVVQVIEMSGFGGLPVDVVVAQKMSLSSLSLL